jgi:hypothetical protein
MRTNQGNCITAVECVYVPTLTTGVVVINSGVFGVGAVSHRIDHVSGRVGGLYEGPIVKECYVEGVFDLLSLYDGSVDE